VSACGFPTCLFFSLPSRPPGLGLGASRLRGFLHRGYRRSHRLRPSASAVSWMVSTIDPSSSQLRLIYEPSAFLSWGLSFNLPTLAFIPFLRLAQAPSPGFRVHFPLHPSALFRGFEAVLPPTPGHHPLPHQPEPRCLLSQREELLHLSQFTTF